jgi:hypothetical protein
MIKGINKIGEVDFLNLKVPVYHTINYGTQCCWRVRNPNVGYKGLIYWNRETGELTYPEGASMPLQTKEDTQIVPQFLITDLTELTTEIIIQMKENLEHDFKLRNRS